MDKLLHAIIFIIFTSPLLAQSISGRVMDAKTRLPVRYASIGLAKVNLGATAGEDGRFAIHPAHDWTGDSLIISSVGYNPVKIPLQNETYTYDVLLEKRDVVLEAVVVRKFFRQLTLPWNKGKSDFSHTTVGLNTQCARLLMAPVTQAQVKSVTVALRKGLFSREKDARFRIRIYDYDSIQQGPGVEICDSVIEVVGGGLHTINLENYQITLPQQRFFVAVQWLFIDENKELIMKQDGKTVDYITYRPGIRMKRTVKGEGNTWMQLHNQQWIRFDYDSSITATVLF